MHLSNGLDELLEVVDRLTHVHTSAVIMEDDDGTEKKVYIKHDPLIKQLRELVHSSIGSSVQGAGLASERNVIDADALEQYLDVLEQSQTLYKTVSDAAPFKLAEANIRHWYIEFRRQVESRKVSHEITATKIRKLNGMAFAIENRLNPPTILEITAPCPRCYAVYGKDEQGVHRKAVVVESRITQYRSLDHTRARCIVCSATWLHGRGMRQLRYEIDNVEELRHADKEKWFTLEQVFEKSDTIEVRSIGVPKIETRP